MGSAAQSLNKPYPGLRSFEAADSDLFFGRGRESGRLLNLILANSFSVLHARSGVGKTSLMSAKVLPALERLGLLAVRIRLQDDPERSTRIHTLKCLAPPPVTEAASLRATLEALRPTDRDLRLGELLTHFSELPIADSRRRALIEHVECPPEATGYLPFVFDRVVPVFRRVLRGSVTVAAFSRHLELLRGERDVRCSSAVTTETPCEVLLEQLEALDQDRYLGLLTRLDVPLKGLLPFFSEIVRVARKYHDRFSVLLVFDQFEEIFTRFVDPGRIGTSTMAGGPDWRHRLRLFAELEKLHSASSSNGSRTPLPLRFLLVLRSEYLAQLDPIRSFANIDRSTFRLGLLDAAEAEKAIQQPASLWDSRITSRCSEAIIDQLCEERTDLPGLEQRGFVEPIQLQIVCDELWRRFGHEPEIGVEHFVEMLGGAKGILSQFLGQFLVELDELERGETLEILQLLITESGTRNIVAESELVDAPFRRPDVRRNLFERIVRRGLVRLERRLSGRFAEITHEFMIGPVIEAVQRETATNPRFWALRQALRILLQYENIDFHSSPSALLLQSTFEELHEQRQRVFWTGNPWAVELMFRSGLRHTNDPEVLRIWSQKYRQCEPLPGPLETLRQAAEHRRQLSLEELLRVSALDPDEVGELTGDEVEWMVRSQLVSLLPLDRERLACWLGRMEG